MYDYFTSGELKWKGNVDQPRGIDRAASNGQSLKASKWTAAYRWYANTEAIERAFFRPGSERKVFALGGFG